MVLRTHHLGYRKCDRTNRMSNLATVCDKCHTPQNHQKGGKLYDLKPTASNKADAAFMNIVRYYVLSEAKKKHPEITITATFGSDTKMSRKELQLEKSHTNDAYAMGEFHPKHRCKEIVIQKTRRNNRILSKFYDAKYIDKRDGSEKTGKQLSSGRTNRNHKLDSENLRVYRGKKLQKGKKPVRQNKYQYQPKDTVIYQGKQYVVKGTNNKGQNVQLYLYFKTDISNVTLDKKNQRKDANPNVIEIGDKVTTKYNGKQKKFKVKEVYADTNMVLLQGDLSTKPNDLKLVKYNNGYIIVKQEGGR